MGFFQVISNPTLYRYGQRLLIAALVLSLFFHVAGIVVWGLVNGRIPWLHPREPSEPIIALSSSTTIQHITVPSPPQPISHARSQTPPVPPAPPRIGAVGTGPAAGAYTPTRARASLRELTYAAPSAPPTPEPTSRPAAAARPRTAHESFAQRLSAEERVFTREVAQLRAQNNPLSVATIPPRPPSSYRRAYLNVSGIDRNQDHYEGIVSPIQTWTYGSLRCHYATYDVEYSSGANDKGNIPWPLCYPPAQDPLTLPDGRPVPNGSPVPAEDLFPMDGYVLPTGTYLTEFLRQLYNRQL